MFFDRYYCHSEHIKEDKTGGRNMQYNGRNEKYELNFTGLARGKERT
jgi:hypothetical protein